MYFLFFVIANLTRIYFLQLVNLMLTAVSLQVFFSSYIFSTNVMVKVATRPAENPVSILSASS
jgi:signal peptide peptidase-like 3